MSNNILFYIYDVRNLFLFVSFHIQFWFQVPFGFVVEQHEKEKNIRRTINTCISCES